MTKESIIRSSSRDTLNLRLQIEADMTTASVEFHENGELAYQQFN